MSKFDKFSTTLFMVIGIISLFLNDYIFSGYCLIIVSLKFIQSIADSLIKLTKELEN